MKKISKTLTLFLVACLIIPMLLPSNVSAATKLSKSSKTMYVGSTYTLKVTGTTKTVKWSSSKKSVATVSTKGKVTAKAAGTCTITAKVSKKSYKCKITVKSKFSSTDAVKNISCDLKDTGNGVVGFLTNKNSVPVSVYATLVYYDDSGKMLTSSASSDSCLEKGATCALFFNPPYDSNYNTVAYSDYKITMSVEKSVYTKSSVSKIKVTSNIGSDNVTVKVTNSNSYNLDYIKLAIVFYDNNKKVIGYDYDYAFCESSGSTDDIIFSFPYDSDYNEIIPASYKIYVNEATAN